MRSSDDITEQPAGGLGRAVTPAKRGTPAERKGMSAERFDAVEVKARLAFLDLIAHEDVAVRRSGPHFIARCPFHEERSGSFTIHGPKHDHGHCFKRFE